MGCSGAAGWVFTYIISVRWMLFLSRLDPTVGENSVVFTVIILRAGGFLDSSKGKFSCFLGGFIHPDTELRSVVSFSGVSLGCFPSVYELFLF